MANIASQATITINGGRWSNGDAAQLVDGLTENNSVYAVDNADIGRVVFTFASPLSFSAVKVWNNKANTSDYIRGTQVLIDGASVFSTTSAVGNGGAEYSFSPTVGTILTVVFANGTSGVVQRVSEIAIFNTTETTVTIDTLRQTTTDTAANIDTLRQLSGPASVTIDTLRRLAGSQEFTIDTLRRLTADESVSIDTLRQTITDATATIDTSRRTKSTISAPIDTSRRRTVPPGTVERISIDIKSGTLADNYSAEMMSDIPLDTAYSALIYGWPLNFTVRSKSFSPATGRYSFAGDNDISELLKKYITFSAAATDAVTIMGMVATQLGKTLSINIDSHGVRRMSEQTTVMQVLSSLFGWTSEIPHQFVNVFLRGNVLNVLQRGKESGNYTLVNFKPVSLAERKIDTLMDSANWAPKIIGDPDGTYQNGTFAFNGVSITYTNGYVTEVVTSDDTTTFAYSADTPDSPDDNKYLLSKSNRKNVPNSTTVVTTYQYQTYRGIEYLASEIEQELMYVNAQFNSELIRERVTKYYPMQTGFYGMQTYEKSWQYQYTFFEGQWVRLFVSSTTSGVQTQMAEGRPGGPVTPRQRSGEENTPMVDIARNPIAANHIPATDTTTLQRYADGLVWLDGKIEQTLRVECYDSHIVDFDQTVTVMGLVWYLQNNSIVMTGQQPKPKQTLDLVRWE